MPSSVALRKKLEVSVFSGAFNKIRENFFIWKELIEAVLTSSDCALVCTFCIHSNFVTIDAVMFSRSKSDAQLAIKKCVAKMTRSITALDSKFSMLSHRFRRPSCTDCRTRRPARCHRQHGTWKVRKVTNNCMESVVSIIECNFGNSCITPDAYLAIFAERYSQQLLRGA